MATDTPDRSNPSRSRKLLVLALDAAEPTLLNAWANDGTLPNIARFMAEGLVGNLRNVEALYVGSTWPSFYTALNPGEHGFYWLDQLVPGTYRTRVTIPSDFAVRKSLWDVLSEAGRRVMVLDVPLTGLTRDIAGIQIVEWGVHDAVFGFQTEPSALAREVLAAVGEYPAPARCDAPSRSVVEYRAFADQLIRGAQARAKLTQLLLAREPWDFAIQVFSESHCAGHQLWHFHDPAHPAFDHATTAQAGDLVRDVYQAIDTAVGEIVRTADDDTTVVLMTLHGMSPMAGAGALLNDILTRLGVMTPMSIAGASGHASHVPTLMQRMVQMARTVYHRIPVRIRAPLYDARQYVSTELLGRGTPINIDPMQSRCFTCNLGPAVSGIRVNLKGREPEGTVAPGPDADQFCERLIRDLLDITDPDTGRALVRRVFKSADLFHGERLDNLPDLLVEWDLQQPVGTAVAGQGQQHMMKAWSARIGLIEQENRYCRTGEHRINGMFIARGPGISAGVIPREISTLDLAPTFAKMVDCEMPDVDGNVVAELLAS